MKRKFPHCLLCSLLALFLSASSAVAETGKVVFVGDAGRASDPEELPAAFAQLATTGGTLVLRGSVHIDKSFVAPAHLPPVVLTSRHAGIDYREEGARLILAGSYTVGGPTTFTDLVIVSAAESSRIHCEGHRVILTESVSCQRVPGGSWPTIVGAAREKGGLAGADLTIRGGKWDRVFGGAWEEDATPHGTLRVTIHGGEFYGGVCATGWGRYTGEATLDVYDGRFYGGVSALGDHALAAMHGTVRITLYGGTYYNTIAASPHRNAEFVGAYHLSLRGGNFISLTDLVGTDGLPGGGTSVLNAEPALLDAENQGRLTFTNPLVEGADPWILQHGGFYYCISTGASQLAGRKVANLADLPYASPVTFFAPPAGRPYSRHLWSPKIYRFEADEVGDENTGFYLYFTANDGTGRSASDHRLYVLRALTEDPLGAYGSPQEGTPDTPLRVASANQRVFQDEWVAGPKVLRYRGKRYLIWVGRVGGPESKKVGDHWQCLYIDELINPWTVAGHPAMICRPTLAWEKHGAGMTGSGSQRRMLPEVVEGGTPVITDDGTLYLLYAGSGYWTPHYAIGLMKLIGIDPMNPSHWQKSPEPIFKASEEVVGSANACYVTSPTGQSHWAIYHAYVGKKTQRVPRHLFAEPYRADRQTMTIGRGTPAPLAQPMTIEANPLPLRNKVRGFSRVSISPPHSSLRVESSESRRAPR